MSNSNFVSPAKEFSYIDCILLNLGKKKSHMQLQFIHWLSWTANVKLVQPNFQEKLEGLNALSKGQKLLKDSYKAQAYLVHVYIKICFNSLCGTLAMN